MIEYMLLFVGLIIIGIQGYLIAKAHQCARNERWEKDTTQVVIDLNGRVQRLEKFVFPDGPQPARTEENMEIPKPDAKPSWMDKWNI